MSDVAVIQGQWWQVTGDGGPSFVHSLNGGTYFGLDVGQFVEVLSEDLVEAHGEKVYFRVNVRSSRRHSIYRWPVLIRQDTFKGQRLKLYFKSNDPKPIPAVA